MYQSGRAGDKAKKRKSPAKSGRVGITAKWRAVKPTFFAVPAQQQQCCWSKINGVLHGKNLEEQEAGLVL